jgi:hypothetical protein
MSDNIKRDDNSGLLTSIWGSNTWNSLHCITFGYPEQPTEENKQHYKIFFESIKFVLPCCTCRKHFAEHTKKGSSFEIKYEIFENRKTLTKWLYDLHSHVNKMLEMKYDITYEDLCEKYNSYIAECVMPIDKKTIAYKNNYDKEAPYVPYEIAMCFKNYAKKRGLNDYAKKLNETYETFKQKRGDKKNLWILRNTECYEITKNMRINSILGFEQDGEFKNLPTIEELKLLQLMCTTMKESSLNHMLEKLGYDFVNSPVFAK